MIKSLAVAVLSVMAGASLVECCDADKERSELICKIAEKVELVLKKHHPEAKVEIIEDTEIVCSFRTRHFKIHTIYRNGTVSEEAFDRVGPGDDGFVLTASVSADPYSGSLANPYGVRRMIYWSQYFNEYKLQDGRGYLSLRFAYGANTKGQILNGTADCCD